MIKKEIKAVSRRNFIKKSSMAIALPYIVPSTVFGKNAPSNKINIGQIGCGRIARGHDLPGTWQHEQARIMAVCDLDRNRTEDAKRLVEDAYAKKGQTIDVKMYDDYRELLLNSDIDAVIISTPDHWHSQPLLKLH